MSISTATTPAVASLLRFARDLFQASNGSGELATLYRLSRGSDSVRPAVNERLARRAAAI